MTTTTNFRPLGIDRHDIVRPYQDLDHRIVLRELARNAEDAALDGVACEVKIEPISGNRGVRVTDNCGGMKQTEMRQYLTNFGAGSRTADDHWGFGLKEIPFFFPGGRLVVTSWTARSENAHQVILRLSEDGRTVGVVLNGTEEVRTVRKPSHSPHGTIVEVHGYEYDSKLILEYLNQRFFVTRIPIRVAIENGGSRMTYVNVRGLMDVMKSLSQMHGEQDYGRLGKLHWFILPERWSPEQVEILHAFKIAPYVQAHKGEAIRWWYPHTGAYNLHSSSGITVAHDRIVLIEEATAAKVRPNLSRTALEGWQPEKFREAVAAALPDELARFITAFESAHYEGVLSQDLVGYFLDMFSQQIRFMQTSAGTTGSNVSGSSGTSGGGGGGSSGNGTSGGGKKPARRGQPKIVFATTGMGELACLYNAAQNTIQVNAAYPTIAVHFEQIGPRTQKKEELKAYIAAHLLFAFARFQAVTDGLPPTDDYLAAQVMNPILADYGSRGLVKVPTARQLGEWRKKRSRAESSDAAES